MRTYKMILLIMILLLLQSCGYFFNKNKIARDYGPKSISDKIGYYENLYLIADSSPLIFIAFGPFAGALGILFTVTSITVDSFGGYYFRNYDNFKYKEWYSQELEKKSYQEKNTTKSE